MGNKIRKLIGFIFIIGGLIIISITGYMKYETYKEQKALMEAFNQMNKAFDGADTEFEEDLNNKDTNKEEEKQEVDKVDKDVDKESNVIALIKIPKIKLEIPVVDSVDLKDIKYVAGHFQSTAYPGEKGNFSVAGHRYSSYGEPFKRLDEIENGDKINVIYKGKEYDYEVTDKFLIDPDDNSILEKTKDATITLITCTMDVKQRIVIKGKCIS